MGKEQNPRISGQTQNPRIFWGRARPQNPRISGWGKLISRGDVGISMEMPASRAGRQTPTGGRKPKCPQLTIENFKAELLAFPWKCPQLGL